MPSEDDERAAPAPVAVSMQDSPEVEVISEHQAEGPGAGPPSDAAGDGESVSKRSDAAAAGASERRRYRRFSVASGILVRTEFGPCTVSSYGHSSVPFGCSVSPIVRVGWEMGRPRIAFVIELETAPVPHFLSGSFGFPFPLVQAVVPAAGMAFGSDTVRGSLSGGVGPIYARVDLRLAITPWLDGRGRRHGFEFGVAYALPTLGQFVANYRIVLPR